MKLKPMKGVYHGRLLEYEVLQNVFLTHLPDYHQLRQRKQFEDNRLIAGQATPKHFFIPNVGVRMLDGQATDVLEGSSLSFQSEYIDIYSNCWGPKDDGKTFGKPGKLAQEALMQGALKVNLLERQGHVWCVVYLTRFAKVFHTVNLPRFWNTTSLNFFQYITVQLLVRVLYLFQALPEAFKSFCPLLYLNIHRVVEVKVTFMCGRLVMED